MERQINIGRLASNDIIINGRYVSDQHAVICKEDGSCFITDLGSVFGTFVNGERISGRVQITRKDKIGNQLVNWQEYVFDDVENTDEGVYFNDLFTTKGRIGKSEYGFLLILILSSPILTIFGVPVFLRFLQYRLFYDQYDLMNYNKPIWVVSYIVIGMIFLMQTAKRIKTIREDKKRIKQL